MASSAQHIDPLFGLTEAIADHIAQKVTQRIRSVIDKAAVDRSELENDLGIEPGRIYTQREVAGFLGASIKSVSRIPELELPRVRRIGSSIGYFGVNVLCYVHKLPPVDTESVAKSFRERLLNERPKIHSMPSTGKKKRVF